MILITAFLFGVFAVFKSPSDPDFGWHYRYGEYLVQHGNVLRQNIFSYTFTDYKWANSYWISQAIMYLTHHYLGHLVAGLFFAIPLSLLTILYVRLLATNLKSGTLLTVFAALLLFVEFSGTGITGRPMYFSSLFLMFLITVLLQDDSPRRPAGISLLWLLPPLFLVWGNTHADFILGLFILGLYVVDRWFLPGVAKYFSGSSPAVPKKSLPLILAVSTLVTLINPFGIQLWQTLLKESNPYQFKHINEWVPVTTDNMYFFAVYCATLGLLVSALIGARHKLPLWYVLMLGFFCIFSIRSQYFYRISVILGSYALLVFWTPYFHALQTAASPALIKKFRIGSLAFLFLSTLAISTLFVTAVHESTDNAYWIEKHGYPQEALNYILANDVTGNVFNYYGWGGYMIWKYPQTRTFIDGRMTSWREGSESIFEDYIKLVDTPAKNTKLLDDYNVRWILYPTEGKFANFIKSNDDWREVYSDDIATVFVR